MESIRVETINRPIQTYKNVIEDIKVIEQTNMVNTSNIPNVIQVETVNIDLVLESKQVPNVTTFQTSSMISINSTFNAGSVEILVKDIIAANPALLNKNNAYAKVEYLFIYKTEIVDKYFVTTSSEIEGDLLTMLIEYEDEHIEVVGNMNIINKKTVEFMSDMDIFGKRARVTYIKKM